MPRLASWRSAWAAALLLAAFGPLAANAAAGDTVVVTAAQLVDLATAIWCAIRKSRSATGASLRWPRAARRCPMGHGSSICPD